MRTLKFKPQPKITINVFCCHQSSKWTSWETEIHFSRVKRSRLPVVIGRFRSILLVSVFQGSLAVAIILIDGSEKPNRQLGFELQSLHAIEKRNNFSMVHCDFKIEGIIQCHLVRNPGLRANIPPSPPLPIICSRPNFCAAKKREGDHIFHALRERSLCAGYTGEHGFALVLLRVNLAMHFGRKLHRER